MPEDLTTTPPGFSEDSGFTPPAEPSGTTQSLSPDNLTLEGNVEGTEATASPLSQEYKAYSQFPWHELPEDARGEFLKHLKKFHGDMTRNSQDVAQLRKDADEYRQKAGYFDSLVNERWFQDAYAAYQQGRGSPNPPPAAQTAPDLSNLGLEPETLQAIQGIISTSINQSLQPLSQELTNVRQQLLTDQTNREMSELRVSAQAKGWPAPDERMSDIAKLIQDGRARTVRDAYHLSIFDEMPSLIENQAKLSLEQELRSKADRTIPPTFSPPDVPGEQVFTGDNAVMEALNASLAEVNARTQMVNSKLGR